MSNFAQFADLPIELLPSIVQHIVRPSHLGALCLVNQSFYKFTIPLLYERVFIYAWHKKGKAKVRPTGAGGTGFQLQPLVAISGHQAFQNIGRLSPSCSIGAAARYVHNL